MLQRLKIKALALLAPELSTLHISFSSFLLSEYSTLGGSSALCLGPPYCCLFSSPRACWWCFCVFGAKLCVVFIFSVPTDKPASVCVFLLLCVILRTHARCWCFSKLVVKVTQTYKLFSYNLRVARSGDAMRSPFWRSAGIICRLRATAPICFWRWKFLR